MDNPAYYPYPVKVSRRALLVTGAVGLLAGAVVVGSVWLGTVLQPSDTHGDDVSAACDVLERIPTLNQATYDTPFARRVEAVTALTSAAAAGDAHYQQLARDTTAAYQALITYDVNTVNERIRAARADCTAL